MERAVQTTAIRLAVLIFFVMAGVGWLAGCSSSACAVRAVGGAMVMYVVVRICGRIVVKILIDAMVDSHVRKQAEKNKDKD